MKFIKNMFFEYDVFILACITFQIEFSLILVSGNGDKVWNIDKEYMHEGTDKINKKKLFLACKRIARYEIINKNK